MTNFLFFGTSSSKGGTDFFLDFTGGVALSFPFGSLGKTSMGAGSARVVLFFL